MTGNYTTEQASFPASRWMRLSLFSLLLIAASGMLMRYKIGFDFPYFDQKNIQHAHSHFAFAGWISQTLMVFLVHLLWREKPQENYSRYRTLLAANLVCSYGMFAAFAAQGYGAVSISFSSLSVLISFWFCATYYSDLKRNAAIKARSWFYAAMLWNVVSSAGTIALAVMMARHSFEQHKYLASVYWYLHFQYNGWFFFSIMGLFHQYIYRTLGLELPRVIFRLFALSCVPVYGLSVLWLELPDWQFVFVAVGAAMQFAGYVYLAVWIYRRKVFIQLSGRGTGFWLLMFAALACFVKLGLQAGSVFPALSKLAFGFRPVVIAYLHLVLLAIVSVFLLWYAYTQQLIARNKTGIAGIILFTGGILLNEITLAVQGVASFTYIYLPDVNFYLFIITAIMFLGVFMLAAAQFKPHKNASPLADSAIPHKTTEHQHG